MKKILVVLAMACMAGSLFAQTAEKAASATMTPPKALDDDFLKSIVGEWEGTTMMPQGTSQEWQKIELALDGQFLMIHYTAKIGESNYRGMGMLTLSPMTGDVIGNWFDNFRGIYKGIGKREGNKVIMRWEGPMGARDETMEKVSADKIVTIFKNIDPNGKVSEGRNEMIRKKATSTK